MAVPIEVRLSIIRDLIGEVRGDIERRQVDLAASVGDMLAKDLLRAAERKVARCILEYALDRRRGDVGRLGRKRADR